MRRGVFLFNGAGIAAAALCLSAALSALAGVLFQENSVVLGLGLTALLNGVVSTILLSISGRLTVDKTADVRVVVIGAVWIWPISCILAAPAFIFSEGQSVVGAMFLAASNLSTTGLSLTVGNEVSQAMMVWRMVLHSLGAASAVAVGGPLLSFVEDRLVKSENRSSEMSKRDNAAQTLIATFKLAFGFVSVAALSGAIILSFLDIPFLDALALCIGAITTGSIEGVKSPFEAPSTIVLLGALMIAGSISFRTHRAFLRNGLRTYRDDEETQLLLFMIVLIALLTFAHGVPLSQSAQVAVSVVSTSGLPSDTAIAGIGSLALLLALATLIGGSSESTSGGLKLIRLRRLAIASRREVASMRSPHSAQADSSRTLDVSLAAWGHAAAFLTVFFVTVCCLAALNIGLIHATILAAATLATNGPLAQLGAPEGVAALGDGAVILLTLVMVIGRVEPLVLLATLFPRFWKG